MGKKLNTAIFILAGTIVNIALILVVAALLLALLYLCRNFIPSGTMPILLIVPVIGGFIVGAIVYQKLALWVIRKFNLEDKLDPIFKPRGMSKR